MLILSLQTFIEIYNAYRKRLADVTREIERINNEMNRIENEINSLGLEIESEKVSTRLRILRKREWYEKFHWMITSSGFLVLGGKDASQNILLIRKFVEDNDIVMHADIHGGSAVVIKTGGKQVDENTIREAAVLAACYSKAWKSGLHAIDVFWVWGSQVSLSPPSGQYLPHGGFMVYGKKNYIKNVELKLAIGLEINKECTLRIVVGPESVVANKAKIYFVIIPGELKVEEVVEAFINELRNRGLGVIANAIDMNELKTKVPGKSKIVKIVVNENVKEVLREC